MLYTGNSIILYGNYTAIKKMYVLPLDQGFLALALVLLTFWGQIVLYLKGYLVCLQTGQQHPRDASNFPLPSVMTIKNVFRHCPQSGWASLLHPVEHCCIRQNLQISGPRLEEVNYQPKGTLLIKDSVKISAQIWCL